MIIDNQTNFLFLADSLPKKYPKFYTNFEKVLNQCKINFSLLPQTKDVWAVDFMPLQIELNKFVRFTYNPSYLESVKDQKTISDTDWICKQIGIDTLKSDILLDVGNVIRWKNKVIITERVFKENKKYHRKELIKKLYELLEVEKIYFIPDDPLDFTGHADGMIRFVDEHTVIINDYVKEKSSFIQEFNSAINATGLDCIKIPYEIDENKNDIQANGCYINYLQMEKTVFIPTFGKEKKDEDVVKQFEKIFKGHNIATINSTEIANDGGILNCISWNILK